jgi:hypothetical protein
MVACLAAGTAAPAGQAANRPARICPLVCIGDPGSPIVRRRVTRLE